MLAWSRLSGRQRAYGVFLVVVFLFGSPILIASAGSIPSQAQIGGALICSIGLILNPLSFTQSVGAVPDLHVIPKVCRGLFIVGGILFFLGIVVTPLFL